MLGASLIGGLGLLVFFLVGGVVYSSRARGAVRVGIGCVSRLFFVRDLAARALRCGGLVASSRLAVFVWRR